MLRRKTKVKTHDARQAYCASRGNHVEAGPDGVLHAQRSAANDDGVLAASSGPTRLLEFARAGELQNRTESSDV